MQVPQRVELINSMGSDKSVVQAARVSFAADKEVRSIEQDAKLINYLAKHNHFTPFCHTAITLRMTAPIPIRTQCFKHKVGFVENEESRRYISSTPDYFVPEWREGVENKKQGSGKKLDHKRQRDEDVTYICHMENAIYSYEDALARGICEEQARLYLPQGCVVNWYWTGSLAAFARMVKQRTDSHAQVEIQELAKMISKVIQPLYPVSWKALVGDV